jgi:MscS family membrane protein
MQIVFVVLIIIEIVHLIFSYLKKWASQTDSTMDDQLVPLLSRLADIIVWAVGIIYILDYLEVNVTALLAGISIGGLAIALAAQDTVKNFFGSVMIFLDKPFQIGDWISFDGVDGVVERVGVRSTRIRTFANSLTYVPNGVFAEKVIDNKGLRIFRRYTTEIAITYDTPTYLIDLFVSGIKDLIKSHPYTRKDSFEVVLNKFDSSSLNILLYAFFTVDNWTDELRGKHDLMKGIINLAEALGVRFAFPSQTLYIEQMPGTHSLTPTKKSIEDAQTASKNALENIKAEFIRPGDEEVGPKNLGGE